MRLLSPEIYTKPQEKKNPNEKIKSGSFQNNIQIKNGRKQ